MNSPYEGSQTFTLPDGQFLGVVGTPFPTPQYRYRQALEISQSSCVKIRILQHMNASRSGLRETDHGTFSTKSTRQTRTSATVHWNPRYQGIF